MPTWSATWTWFSSLKSFSAEICDASGRVIRKLGKGDLNYTEYSQHLADDAAYYWLEPPLSVFPCTVRYRYETAHKNGMFARCVSSRCRPTSA